MKNNDKKMPFFKWVENYWYHNKAITICVFIALVIFSWGAYLILSVPNYDIQVVAATYGDVFTMPKNITANDFLQEGTKQENKFKSSFAKYSFDLNGDGEIKVELRTIPIFEKKRAGEENTSFDESLSPDKVNQLDMGQRQKLIANLGDNKSIIFVLDEEIYEIIKDVAEFTNLENQYSDIKSDKLKGDKFYLSDCEMLEDLKDNKIQDTFICVRKLEDLKDSKNPEIQKLHEKSLETVKNIIMNNKDHTIN